jgi:hypothetical protein
VIREKGKNLDIECSKVEALKSKKRTLHMFFTKWIDTITVILINLLGFLLLKGLERIFKPPYIRSTEEIRGKALVMSLVSDVHYLNKIYFYKNIMMGLLTI